MYYDYNDNGGGCCHDISWSAHVTSAKPQLTRLIPFLYFLPVIFFSLFLLLLSSYSRLCCSLLHVIIIYLVASWRVRGGTCAFNHVLPQYQRREAMIASDQPTRRVATTSKKWEEKEEEEEEGRWRWHIDKCPLALLIVK